MSEIYKDNKKGTIIIECDCGINHKIKLNDEGDVELVSKLSKKKIEPEKPEEIKLEEKKDDGKKKENTGFGNFFK